MVSGIPTASKTNQCSDEICAMICVPSNRATVSELVSVKATQDICLAYLSVVGLSHSVPLLLPIP
jgi:hypothetical protein